MRGASREFAGGESLSFSALFTSRSKRWNQFSSLEGSPRLFPFHVPHRAPAHVRSPLPLFVIIHAQPKNATERPPATAKSSHSGKEPNPRIALRKPSMR